MYISRKILMIRQKSQKLPKIRSGHSRKPTQAFENTKPSDLLSELIIPDSVFQRYLEFAAETEKLADLEDEKAKKLAARKKATYEMSKNWDNTVENIKKRRKEELLSKRKQADAERQEFVKNMALKNAEEREKTIKEAKKLLFYGKPQCRLINGALLTSECLRELEVQLEFQKKLKSIDEEKEKEYADRVKKEAEEFQELRNRKLEEELKKKKSYAAELKKQIEEIAEKARKDQEEELESQRQELLKLEKILKEAEKAEEEEKVKRRLESNKMLRDAIAEKQRLEMELSKENEFQERTIEIYAKCKRRIEDMRKMEVERERREQFARTEELVKKCAISEKSHEEEEEEIRQKAMREAEAKELERIESRKRYEENMKKEIQDFQKEHQKILEKRKLEEKDFRDWETLQRYKRDEFDKEFLGKEREREWKKKMDCADALRKQMKERQEAARAEVKDDWLTMKSMVEKTNNKVLSYAEEVLNQSRGVRPLFPILKTLQDFKREAGLLPAKKREDPGNSGSQKKMKRIRKVPEMRKIPEEQICYV